jgi:hypothetical protein
MKIAEGTVYSCGLQSLAPCLLLVWLMDTVCLLLRIPRRNIGLLCSIVAGYEGVAVVRTIDSRQGLVELLVAPVFYATALTLLHALTQDLDLHLIDAGESMPPLPEETQVDGSPCSMANSLSL